MTTAACDQDVQARIEALMPELVEARHDLHAHPELGYEEHRTSDVVQQHLAKAGVAFESGLAGGTGVLAHIPGGDGPPVALRADMDALPIHEESGVAWTSTHEGRMHACGHDGHTTMLIGTAHVLAGLAADGDLPRPVTLVFQPAEEGGAGGKRMVEDGCLDGSVIGPAISEIHGQHGWTNLVLGSVASCPGPMLAAADGFELTITGTGGHAAMPHLCADPIACTAAVIASAQQVVSRRVDPVQGGVLSFTKVSGGSTHNIIPERVEIMGTSRSLYPEAGAALHEGLESVLDGVCSAHGCTFELTWHDGYPVTVNDEGAHATFEQTASAVLGSECVERLAPVMGGEDFSYYGHQVPANFFALGLLPPGQTRMPGLHHPCFDFNDMAMPVGIRLFAALATRPA